MENNKFELITEDYIYHKTLLQILINNLKAMNNNYNVIKNINTLSGIFIKIQKDIIFFQEVYFNPYCLDKYSNKIYKVWKEIRNRNPYFEALITSVNPHLNASVPFSEILEQCYSEIDNIKDCVSQLDYYFNRLIKN